MNDEKSEALKLADELIAMFGHTEIDERCAVELRRLHDANLELVDALKWYQHMAKQMGIAAICSNSKAILELMKEIAVDSGKRASSAIAKATGDSND